jgi:hypothetical protein
LEDGAQVQGPERYLHGGPVGVVTADQTGMVVLDLSVVRRGEGAARVQCLKDVFDRAVTPSWSNSPMRAHSVPSTARHPVPQALSGRTRPVQLGQLVEHAPAAARPEPGPAGGSGATGLGGCRPDRHAVLNPALGLLDRVGRVRRTVAGGLAYGLLYLGMGLLPPGSPPALFGLLPFYGAFMAATEGVTRRCSRTSRRPTCAVSHSASPPPAPSGRCCCLRHYGANAH